VPARAIREVLRVPDRPMKAKVEVKAKAEATQTSTSTLTLLPHRPVRRHGAQGRTRLTAAPA
jgi:hypothetical protein